MGARTCDHTVHQQSWVSVCLCEHTLGGDAWCTVGLWGGVNETPVRHGPCAHDGVAGEDRSAGRSVLTGKTIAVFKTRRCDRGDPGAGAVPGCLFGLQREITRRHQPSLLSAPGWPPRLRAACLPRDLSDTRSPTQTRSEARKLSVLAGPRGVTCGVTGHTQARFPPAGPAERRCRGYPQPESPQPEEDDSEVGDAPGGPTWEGLSEPSDFGGLRHPGDIQKFAPSCNLY